MTGLQQSRYRYYGAQIGRFLNRDPIGYRGGPNLYGYVGGRSTYYVDPFGLQAGIEGPGPGPYDPTDRWPMWNEQVAAAYAGGHCKCECFSAAFQHGRDGLQDQLQDIRKEAENFAGSEMWGDLEEEYFEFYTDGPIFGEGRGLHYKSRLHSAIRHCVASGLAAAKYGCDCSACLFDNRDLVQYHWYNQSPANTQQALYNNREGRKCSGCKGKSGNTNPRRVFRSAASIKKCCKQALLAGELATDTGDPNGLPTIPIRGPIPPSWRGGDYDDSVIWGPSFPVVGR